MTVPAESWAGAKLRPGHSRPRLVHVVTHPATARVLLAGQLKWLAQQGFDVVLVCAPGPELDGIAEREGVRVLPVPMERDIDVLGDGLALLRLTRLLRGLEPDIVIASTTKAGLLGVLAARLVSVPHVVYLLRGLRLETMSGVRRAVLTATEKLALAAASSVVCVSPSLRDVVMEHALCAPEKLVVLGHGSSNGVNLERFTPRPELEARARALALKHGFGPNEVVFGFVGRPVPDKGLAFLIDAFRQVRELHSEARLLLVGGGFADDELEGTLRELISAQAGVTAVEAVTDIAPYYLLMRSLVFPSLREGFGNVVLEAGASERPAIGFRVTGVRDSIVDGETGILVEPRDSAGLAAAMLRHLEDPGLATAQGKMARARVERSFAQHLVWEHWGAFLRGLLRAAPQASHRFAHSK